MGQICCISSSNYHHDCVQGYGGLATAATAATVSSDRDAASNQPIGVLLILQKRLPPPIHHLTQFGSFTFLICFGLDCSAFLQEAKPHDRTKMLSPPDFVSYT
ncbi:hypothetical protein FPOA_14034 [Fusarium poae]|uniref:Uncharacterized protein n=1 Tax=Fusarium poae TaxID=36050 RepID=A0A1B8A3F1_FUSPO|nr:hypothetical protein FPOA_14034 [Fusarium poae]